MDKIKSYSIDQIEERMKEIRSLNLDEHEDLEGLEKEIDLLEQRKKELLNSIDKKKELRTKIATGNIETKTIEKPIEEERGMDLNKDNVLSSKEFRNAWSKTLLGRELNAEERTAIALTNVEGAVPEELQDNILTKVKDYCPVINDITLLNVEGAVKFAVEGVVNPAAAHKENATITASSDTLTEVSLSTYELVKLIQISASVKTMTIPAFEKWIVEQLVQALAIKVESLIFSGTGTNEAKGVDAITWGSSNSITVTQTGTTTAQNVYNLFALLKDGYARNAKAYMSRKTLFSDLLGLQDKSKNDLVAREGSNYYILGTKVEFTSNIGDHEIILGDMKRYVANMPETTSVKTAFHIDSNSYKYLGVNQFDGKPAIEEAFVKLIKAKS